MPLRVTAEFQLVKRPMRHYDDVMTSSDAKAAADGSAVREKNDASPLPPSVPPGRLPLEPMDPQIRSIQPGGGVCMSLELAWGHVRRWYLKTFRKGYVSRMAALRQGENNACPFDALDPRDVKFYRNQQGYHWAPADDPFTWRDRLPFARVGLTELWLISGTFFLLAALFAWGTWDLGEYLRWLTAVPLFLGGSIVWFFRNPHRTVPRDAGVVVSPADGTIVQIDEIAHDEFIGGPAVLIGIFLSVFNVHINRVPVAARVIGLSYRKGKFLNALRPESARENEQLAVRIEENQAPYRRMIVRQITGAIARRIVCWVKPGDELAAGEQFGMIKLGSRTELVLPREEGLQILVRLGDKVQAGSRPLARYNSSTG
jgi:phosphatidylserine decarboxylase